LNGNLGHVRVRGEYAQRAMRAAFQDAPEAEKET
jgi:hypothetical protein